MKITLLILLPIFLFAFEIFPHTSEQFKGYGIGFGSHLLGKKFIESITDDYFFQYLFTIGCGVGAGLIFSRHLEGIEGWYCLGKGQSLVVIVGIDLLEWWRRSKEKPKMAYAEEHYDEIIEYGLEQIRKEE